jgi:hypothetical protein
MCEMGERRRGQEYRGLVAQAYESEAAATEAVRALIDAGFAREHISVAARDRGTARGVSEETGIDVAGSAAVAAGTGGALGAVAGVLAGVGAIAIPGIGLVAGPIALALAGAGAGGLVGALAGLGMSEDDVSYYADKLDSGQVVVTVMAGEREHIARQLLGHNVTDDDAAIEPHVDLLEDDQTPAETTAGDSSISRG